MSMMQRMTMSSRSVSKVEMVLYVLYRYILVARHPPKKNEVRAKKPSLTLNLGPNGLNVTSEPPPMAEQAGCLQGQDRLAVTYPSSSHARRCLIWLSYNNRCTRYTGRWGQRFYALSVTRTLSRNRAVCTHNKAVNIRKFVPAT
ncbi:hypothetical protein J6590_006289 [Homalodisca vitripennis]|nr:hypothetical protein J6590_006289 [Homalodisca vitripennis]